MRPPFPADITPSGYGDDSLPWHERRAPSERLRRWGMGLFLVSLTSLFIASLVGYLVVISVHQRAATPLPTVLWISTGVLFLCASAILRMQHAIRIGRIDRIRFWIVSAWLLSIGFLCVQVPGMWELAMLHQAAFAAEGEAASVRATHGLVLTLILLHAVHVLGGLVPLSWLAFRMVRQGVGVGDLTVLRGCAMYWHFLELVWIVIFATLLLAN